MHSLCRTLLAATALILAAACQPGAETGADEAVRAEATVSLNEFLDGVFERELAQSPIRQSMLGRKTDELGQWDDFSDAAEAARIERTRQALADMLEQFDYDTLNPQDRLSYDLFRFEAEQAIADHEFLRHHYVVDQFNGQLSELITVLQNNHPIESADDAEDYISRLENLETVLKEFAVKLGDRAGFGVVAPAFSFPAVLTDARNMSSGAPIEDTDRDNAVFTDFENKIDALELDAARREELLLRASAALRGPFALGFAALIDQVERIEPLATGNRGVWSLPDGDAYYRNRIRHHTTLDLSADEIHEIGLSDVARIHDEMRAIRDEVGFDGTLAEFFEFIRNDPNNYYEDSDRGREQFLDDARRQIAEIYATVGDYFSAVPEAGLEVRRVEPWRENSTSIAFYNRPSEDGSRPGIYYANLADMTSVQKYVFTAITYHESAPGHHFQIALAQELDGLPEFRKYSGYGAFIEGWALYAEQLAREMGFYENPYANFGRLQNELWRSVRLVLDTGIHAKRWTREQCIEYFQDSTPLSEGDIVTEVERFFVNPGQALGYKLGMMKILELRERARRELGDRFDIRDFHDAVIGAGPLPLTLLERQVEDYIRSTTADAT
ncbi:MAG: DUF885 domain-containing protein [Woeseiaceae bacterium]|jgi:uncharacterized protein (DUF885 family)|nr:DUF885 domain-containing protein [Woeseiaceae bacterium]